MALDDKLHTLLKFYYSSPQFLTVPIGFLYRFLPESIRYGEQYKFFNDLMTLVDTHKIEEMSNLFFANTIKSASNIKFYQELYASHGLVFSQIQDLRDVASLPIINKSDIQNNLTAMFNKEDKAKLLYMTTGGSTGEPVGFYLQKNVTRSKELAFFNNLWSSFGYNPNSKLLTIRGINLEGKLSRYESIKNNLLISSYSITDQNIFSIIKSINKFCPEFIHAYPSSMYLLVRLMDRYNLKFKKAPRAIFCGSENLYPEQVHHVEKTLRTKIVGWYGHAERLILGYRNNLTEKYSFDPLYGHAETKITGGNEFESLIATGYHNTVMPLIRYNTGDLVMNPKKNNYILEVDRIEGRSHEFVYDMNFRPISMTAINMHDSVFDNINRFQFSQKKAGHVDFIYEANINNNVVDEHKIKNAISRKLGQNFTLSIKRVNHIELTKTGKQTFLLNSIDKK